MSLQWQCLECATVIAATNQTDLNIAVGRHKAIDLLDTLAESCSRAEDVSFWILASAAFRLRGGRDDESSTAAVLFWGTLGTGGTRGLNARGTS